MIYILKKIWKDDKSTQFLRKLGISINNAIEGFLELSKKWENTYKSLTTKILLSKITNIIGENKNTNEENKMNIDEKNVINKKAKIIII